MSYQQYPPPGQYYPPQGGQYPPPAGYPPQNSSPYPPQGGQYQPPQPHGQHPPPHGYAPQGSPYPAQGGHYQPPQGPPQGQYSQSQGYPPNPPPSGYPPYGAPQGAPQGGYSPYGAPPGPPPGGWGGPPSQQEPPYGAPPPGSVGPPTRPSMGYEIPEPMIQWDARPDAVALRKAMKGFGTDEKTLIKILTDRDPYQIAAIRKTFYQLHNRDLEKDIRSETSGNFEKGLIALARGPLLNDVHLLNAAIAGVGTDEVVLNDVLLGRSNADMNAIKRRYQEVIGRPLDRDVEGDLSMKTKRHFSMVLAATRAEDSAPVIPQAVEQDVNEIYNATEGKVGTDEVKVCQIFSSRNDNQLRAIGHTYQQKYRRSLEKVVESEFSGHMKEALLFQLRNAMDKYMHAATLLEKAMAGAGTKDDLLISRVVRFHWDQETLANIRGAYEKMYKKSLSARIRGETSGDYERLLVACVERNRF
ncbi:hypothetical protein F5Y17DRAFT_413807 [Xylariaceae sp. FL0594]|nr:hypothetical protein F5Y17DRAFT_413807 [Xylariaceae sp. FL0594]